jgi:hypothetical protein
LTIGLDAAYRPGPPGRVGATVFERILCLRTRVVHGGKHRRIAATLDLGALCPVRARATRDGLSNVQRVRGDHRVIIGGELAKAVAMQSEPPMQS